MCANFNSAFTITTSVADGALAVNGSKTMTGTAVNDAPNATNLNAAESFTEDASLNLIDIVVSDVDNATTTATLVMLDLSSLPLADGSSSSLLAGLGAHGFLDVVVQDDTAVDFARLDMAYCCQ